MYSLYVCTALDRLSQAPTSVHTQPRPLFCTWCGHVCNDGSVVASPRGDLCLTALCVKVLNMRIFALLWLVMGRPEGEGQDVPVNLLTAYMQSRELQSYLASTLGGG